MPGVPSLDRLRSVLPESTIPAAARLAAGLHLARGSRRAAALAQVRALHGAEHDDAACEALVAPYVRYYAWRSESRRHLAHETDLPVHGVEHLDSLVAAGRPVLLSFLHHGPWEGSLASVGRSHRLQVVVNTRMIADDAPDFIRDMLRKGQSTGNTPFDVAEGPAGIEARLVPGAVVAVANDVLGTSPVQFLGQRIRCGIAAAHVSWRTGTPIVVMTCRRPEGRRGVPTVHLSAPLEPTAQASKMALHQAIMSAHEPFVRAWPEAYEQPLDRITFPDAG